MTSKTDKKRSPAPPLGHRGPVEHERREQIVKAANEHFRRYGYNKTTVADLANAIGLSTAYIYKFFEFEAGDRRSRLRRFLRRDCLRSAENRAPTEVRRGKASLDVSKPDASKRRALFQ